MALRKKEKPLSIEEIRQKIKKDSAAHWLHSEPLFGLAAFPEGPKLLTLSEADETPLFVVFLLDAGDYLTDRVIEALNLWKDRYRKLGWKPVVVFQQKYLFLKNAKFYERFKSFPVFPTIPIYLDPFGDLYEKYGSQSEPVVFFLNQGELTYSAPISNDFGVRLSEIENQLHQNLRQRDPGLPLPLLYEYEIDAPCDTRTFRINDVTRAGQWIDGQNSLVTDDPHATLTFGFEGKCLRLIATLHPQARENARIHVTFDDQPVHLSIQGAQLHPNDKGQSIVEINRNTGIYEIIQSNEPIRGIVRIHFHLVIETPVIFYELRQA